jgi:hypothetical protein
MSTDYTLGYTQITPVMLGKIRVTRVPFIHLSMQIPLNQRFAEPHVHSSQIVVLRQIHRR